MVNKAAKLNKFKKVKLTKDQRQRVRRACKTTFPRGDGLFKEHKWQKNALKCFAAGWHTLVVAKTGDGKSKVIPLVADYCMQMDPQTVMLVCDPMGGLMADQADALKDRPEFNVTFYNTRGHLGTQRTNIKALKHREVFVQPEIINEDWFKDLCLDPIWKQHLRCVIYDECHLVHYWEKIRPYEHMTALLASSAKVLMMTGSLIASTEKSVMQHLTLPLSYPAYCCSNSDSCYSYPQPTHYPCAYGCHPPAPPLEATSHLERTIQSEAPRVVRILVHGLAGDEVPRDLISKMASILYGLLDRWHESFRQWFYETLADPSFPSSHLQAHEKELVLEVVCGMRHQLEGKFRALITDFSAIGRAQNTAECLVAYQIR